ncbi:AraC family transcriptional regulator [Claveliimonas bilis]|uniref:AraC family transcriptional regulator n=1 Tax=Claveliimonas bilis TaxID=3028070 RepID=A0ABM8I1J1_9FIRM|nr:AraC family transcriptional regulator [Claveliimonas bilis]BDZ76753.1 AraC family transcriptional regulator [Claveliimonas bilis]
MEDSYVLQMKNRKFSDFYLCFCGYAKCSPLHSFGPAVRPNYILHYIVDGKGKFLVNGEEYNLQKGQGFLIEPEVQTFYQADEEVPWTYLWIGFGGKKAEDYLRDLGLNKKQLIFQCGCGEELKQIVYSMLKHRKYTAANEYFLEGLLYTFFGTLKENMEIAGNAGEKDGNLYVRKAVEFIQNNYADPVRVKDIADYVGVNRSYLYTLFQDNLQLSPKEYLTNFRLTRAAELLQLTDLSVETVAMSCGYQDALGFSKIFKAKMGITPSAYRKENAAWQETKRKEEIDLTF